MLPWMLGGLAIIVALAWKLLHDAQVDDKTRARPNRNHSSY
jgi:hypothetical protein